MDREIARQVNNLMLEFGKKLDESAILVLENCSEEEFKLYRHAIGKIMTAMLLDIMNPLYKEHPDLKPPELD